MPLDNPQKRFDQLVLQATKAPSYTGDVRVREGRYFVWRPDRHKFSPITNFTVAIKNRFITDDGCIREVSFVNVRGEESEKFILEPSFMSTPSKFKEFCFSKGNFISEANGHDLIEIWKHEMSKDTGRKIYQIDHVGYLPNHKIWLFDNIAVNAGKLIYPDENGVFWSGNDGFRALPLRVKGKFKTRLPQLLPFSQKDGDIKLFFNHALDVLKNNWGTYAPWLGIGWAKANVYRPEIFKKFGFFPLLFPYGKFQCGKNTFVKTTILPFWRMSNEEGLDISESTQTGISRSLAHVSSMPVWLDEFRNTDKIKRLSGFLRDVYNGIGATKGIKDDFGTRYVDVLGTLIVTGEELPTDPGLRSRFIPVYISRKDRNKDFYQEAIRVSEDFSSVMLHWILEKNDDLTNALLEDIGAIKHELMTQYGFDDRSAENYAVPMAAFFSIKRDENFYQWVVESAKRDIETKNQEQVLQRFLDDVEALAIQNKIPNQFLELDHGTREVRLHLKGIHDLCAKEHRQRTGETPPFDRSTLADHFREEPYFKGIGKHYINGKQSRGVLILNIDECPDGFADAVGRNGHTAS